MLYVDYPDTLSNCYLAYYLKTKRDWLHKNHFVKYL